MTNQLITYRLPIDYSLRLSLMSLKSYVWPLVPEVFFSPLRDSPSQLRRSILPPPMRKKPLVPRVAVYWLNPFFSNSLLTRAIPYWHPPFLCQIWLHFSTWPNAPPKKSTLGVFACVYKERYILRGGDPALNFVVSWRKPRWRKAPPLSHAHSLIWSFCL